MLILGLCLLAVALLFPLVPGAARGPAAGFISLAIALVGSPLLFIGLGFRGWILRYLSAPLVAIAVLIASSSLAERVLDGAAAEGQRLPQRSVVSTPAPSEPTAEAAASACRATCSRLENEEPRDERERELDQASYAAYKSCVDRERGDIGAVETKGDAANLVQGMKACKGRGTQACIARCTGTSVATFPTADPELAIEYPLQWPRGVAKAVFDDCRRQGQQTTPSSSEAAIFGYCNCVVRETASIFPAEYAESEPSKVLKNNVGAFARCSL